MIPRFKLTKRDVGQRAEDNACDYLKRQGLQLITRNYRSKYGEIDLIMRDQSCIVFVEVRFRRRQDHGSGSETVVFYKQQRIIKTALCYLRQKGLLEKMPCRFDVVAIKKDAENIHYEWLKDAFQAGGFF